MVSLRSMRNAAAGAAGVGALAAAMLFGSIPAAEAVPAPAAATSFAVAGPHGDISRAPAVVPIRGGRGGRGNGGWGHPGGGNGWGHPGRGFWGAPGHWWNWWW